MIVCDIVEVRSSEQKTTKKVSKNKPCTGSWSKLSYYHGYNTEETGEGEDEKVVNQFSGISVVSLGEWLWLLGGVKTADNRFTVRILTFKKSMIPKPSKIQNLIFCF